MEMREQLKIAQTKNNETLLGPEPSNATPTILFFRLFLAPGPRAIAPGPKSIAPGTRSIAPGVRSIALFDGV